MILNKTKLRKLNNSDLQLQIDLHHHLKFKSKSLPAKSNIKAKAKMLKALDDAIDHFLSLPEDSHSISTLNVVVNNVHITVEDGWESDGIDDT